MLLRVSISTASLLRKAFAVVSNDGRTATAARSTGQWFLLGCQCGLPTRCPMALRVTCGRRLGKCFLTLVQHWSVRSRVRPVDAALVTAGPNALRGSGPNRLGAIEVALTQTGSPNPRLDRICITSSCPCQFKLPSGPRLAINLLGASSAPCTSRRAPSWPRPSVRSCWRARRRQPLPAFAQAN